MIYLGIDPGASGGLAFVTQNDQEAVSMPATERDVFQWMAGWKNNPPIAFAMIEKVGGFIGIPHPGSAMFKFGASYGGLRMALVAAGIPFDEVTPQRWQKALGVSPRKKTESKGQFKNRLKSKAQQLFPKLGVTLKTCDAILLAEYCRRLKEGKL